MLFVPLIFHAPLGAHSLQQGISLNNLRHSYLVLPNSCRPAGYWYFMAVNLSERGITSDFKSKKAAGIEEYDLSQVAGPVTIDRTQTRMLSSIRKFNLNQMILASQMAHDSWKMHSC